MRSCNNTLIIFIVFKTAMNEEFESLLDSVSLPPPELDLSLLEYHLMVSLFIKEEKLAEENELWWSRCNANRSELQIMRQ